jgi:LysM repeat protein
MLPDIGDEDWRRWQAQQLTDTLGERISGLGTAISNAGRMARPAFAPTAEFLQGGGIGGAAGRAIASWGGQPQAPPTTPPPQATPTPMSTLPPGGVVPQPSPAPTPTPIATATPTPMSTLPPGGVPTDLQALNQPQLLPGPEAFVTPPPPAPTVAPTSVPAPAPAPTPRTYSVQPGETLSEIGERFGVPYQQIASASGISDPNRLQIGQQLTIPGAGTTTQAAAAVGPPAPLPTTGNDLRDYARQAAVKAGIDPDIFERQIQRESQFRTDQTSSAGAVGIAQLVPKYYPGVDPRNPYQSLDAAARTDAENLAKYNGDWAKTLAAYNAGAGAVAQAGGIPPYPETQQYVHEILENRGVARIDRHGEPQVSPQEGLARVGAAQAAPADISQFGDRQLNTDEAYAACGPAAAVRFAERFGRNPTLREAVDLAKSVGWTTNQGMAGIASEKALLDKMDVPNTLVPGADWGKFAEEAKTGNPVVISTRGHYYYADGYDQASNRFHVGRSGTDLKGGSEWMTPQEMTNLMGPVQGGLLSDAPTVNAPSSTVKDQKPTDWLDTQRQNLTDSLGGALTSAQRALADIQSQTQEAIRHGQQALDEQIRQLDLAVSTAADNARQQVQAATQQAQLGIGGLLGGLGTGASQAQQNLSGLLGTGTAQAQQNLANVAQQVQQAQQAGVPNLLGSLAPQQPQAQSPLEQLGSTIGSAISGGLRDFLQGGGAGGAAGRATEDIRNQIAQQLQLQQLQPPPDLASRAAQAIQPLAQAVEPVQSFLEQGGVGGALGRATEPLRTQIAAALPPPPQLSPPAAQDIQRAATDFLSNANDFLQGGGVGGAAGRAIPTAAAAQPPPNPAAEQQAVASGSLYDENGNPIADFRSANRFGVDRVQQIVQEAGANIAQAPQDPLSRIAATLQQVAPTAFELTAQAPQALTTPFQNLLGATANALYGEQFPLIRQVAETQGPDAAFNAFMRTFFDPQVGVYRGPADITPDFVRRAQAILDQNPQLATFGGPQLDLSRPLAQQIPGYDIAQQLQGGVGQAVRGVQQGNVGDILGGTLTTALGLSAALPGAGGVESLVAAGARPAAAAVLEAGRYLNPQQAAAVAQNVPLIEAAAAVPRAAEPVVRNLGLQAGATIGEVLEALPQTQPATRRMVSQALSQAISDAGYQGIRAADQSAVVFPQAAARIPSLPPPAPAAAGAELLARQPAQAQAGFAARLGGAAAGAGAGYVTTPEGATPQERIARTALGGALGLGGAEAALRLAGRAAPGGRVVNAVGDVLPKASQVEQDVSAATANLLRQEPLAATARGGVARPGIAGAEAAIGAEAARAELAAMPALQRMTAGTPEVERLIARSAREINAADPAVLDRYAKGSEPWRELTKEVAEGLSMPVERVSQGFNTRELLTLRSAILDGERRATELNARLATVGGDASRLPDDQKAAHLSGLLEQSQLREVLARGEAAVRETLAGRERRVTETVLSRITAPREATAAQRAAAAAEERAGAASAEISRLSGRELSGAEQIRLRSAQRDLAEANRTAELARQRAGAAQTTTEAFRQSDLDAIETRLRAMGGRVVEGGKVTDQMLEQYAKAQASRDPLALAKYLRGIQNPSFWRQLGDLDMLRYGGMLSGTVTHFVQLGSNALGLVLMPPIHAVGSVADAAIQATRGGERTRYLAEIGPQILGMGAGFKSRLPEAYEVLTSGVNARMVNADLEHLQLGFQAAQRPLKRAGFGAVTGAAAGFYTAPEGATLQERLERAGAGAVAGAGLGVAARGRALGAAIDVAAEAPLRLLQASDLLFRGAAEEARARGVSLRQAFNEGKRGAEAGTRAQEILQNLDQFPELLNEVKKTGLRTVFQEQRELGGLRLPSRETAFGRLLSIPFPFQRTPMNIIAQGAGMTPAGVAGVIEAARNGQRGEAVDRVARAAIGTAVMTGATILGAGGFLTADYPEDQKERSTLPEGWRPWSLIVPQPNNKVAYVAYSQLGNLGTPLAAAAILGQAQKKGQLVSLDTLGKVAMGVAKYSVDQSTLRGMNDVLNAIVQGDRFGENFIEGVAGQFQLYGGAQRQIIQAQGIAARDVHGALDALLAGNILTTQQVPARQTPLGRELPAYQTGLSAFISPVRYGGGPASDVVLDELRRYKVGIPAPPKEVHGVPLTPEEQRAFQQQSGELIAQRIPVLMRNPAYIRAKPIERQRMLQRAVELDRSATTALMMQDLADIQRRRAERRRQQEAELA